MAFFSNHQHGLFAEFIARWWLRVQGYRILARRFKTPVGEIDLIAKRGKTLVFIEVKKRLTLSLAAFSLHPKQQHRLMKTALWYQQYNNMHTYTTLRWDVIVFNRFFLLRHLKNVMVKNTYN